MEYRIRFCKEKDLLVLIELCRKHAAYERASYKEEGKAEQLKKLLFDEKPCLYCMVVEVGEKLVGYASYTFDCSTWDAGMFLYLDCLYLEDEYRGFGIGEAMMGKLKCIAKDQNCVNIQWQTPVFNERAVKFYNRIGGIGNNKVRFVLSINEI